MKRLARRLLPTNAPPRPAAITLAVYAAVVCALAVLTGLLVPPATDGLPDTVYVDTRIGDDANHGRTPKQPMRTLSTALRRAPDGATVLLMGYGHDLRYEGTGTECVTLRGTADDPFTIRRNTYTNTLYTAQLTTREKVGKRWRLVGTRTGSGGGAEDGDGEDAGADGRVRTWSVPWPDEILLGDEPQPGFLKLGEIGITGYPEEPDPDAVQVAWWADGRLYYRDDHYDPNEYDVFVKNGDGLCISGDSAHVRVVDLTVNGAVHAVRVEPGAQDVGVRHIFRTNVLGPDARGDQKGGR